MLKYAVVIFMVCWSLQNKTEGGLHLSEGSFTSKLTVKETYKNNELFETKKRALDAPTINESFEERPSFVSESGDGKSPSAEHSSTNFSGTNEVLSDTMQNITLKVLVQSKYNKTKLHEMKGSYFKVESGQFRSAEKSVLDKISKLNTTSETTCRTRDGKKLPPDLFSWDTCAHCYRFELSKKFHPTPPWIVLTRTFDLEFKKVDVRLLRNFSDSQHETEANVSNDDLFLSISDPKFRNNWKECCMAAIRCCEVMQKDAHTNLTKFCPRTWDGWQCWKDTLSDSHAFEPCPRYSYIDTVPTCIKMATKRCDSNGTWFRRREREWTNYSPCGVLPKIHMRFVCHICTLSLSILALVPALLVFSCFRQLRGHRITLHKQLFVSLLFESCCSLSFRLLQMYGVEIMKKSPVWCVVLCLIRKYARQTNYAWYLCEGFYLHKLLVSAFAEQKSLALFYVIGWVFPILPVGLYMLFRGIWHENPHCWNLPVKGLEWLIKTPPLLAIMINLIFMINVIRILLGKVRNTNNMEPRQFRMAVRATLMVVPLFGLQYVVTIYRPPGQTCYWLDLYHVINNIIDGSTGFIVAIIFCFANSEVRELLRRKWMQLKDHPGPVALRRISDSFSFRSRSLSTAQTTLVDTQTAARRTSSIVFTNVTGSQLGSKNATKTLPSGSAYLQQENLTLSLSDRAKTINNDRVPPNTFGCSDAPQNAITSTLATLNVDEISLSNQHQNLCFINENVDNENMDKDEESPK